jgi:hypothetical protein
MLVPPPKRIRAFAISFAIAIALVASPLLTDPAHAVTADPVKYGKIHKKKKGSTQVYIYPTAWNDTFCSKSGVWSYECNWKTATKAKKYDKSKKSNPEKMAYIKVNKIRNEFTLKCNGIGMSISVNPSGPGATVNYSSSEVTKSVQNTNASIVDYSGAATCHLNPLVWVAFPALNGFTRYVTGSYGEVWIEGSRDYTKRAWTW